MRGAPGPPRERWRGRGPGARAALFAAAQALLARLSGSRSRERDFEAPLLAPPRCLARPGGQRRAASRLAAFAAALLGGCVLLLVAAAALRDASSRLPRLHQGSALVHAAAALRLATPRATLASGRQGGAHRALLILSNGYSPPPPPPPTPPCVPEMRLLRAACAC